MKMLLRIIYWQLKHLKIKDTPIVIQLYLNISDVYSKFGDTLKCVEYTAKAEVLLTVMVMKCL